MVDIDSDKLNELFGFMKKDERRRPNRTVSLGRLLVRIL